MRLLAKFDDEKSPIRISFLWMPLFDYISLVKKF
jgi:hypothetical protein